MHFEIELTFWVPLSDEDQLGRRVAAAKVDLEMGPQLCTSPMFGYAIRSIPIVVRCLRNYEKL